MKLIENEMTRCDLMSVISLSQIGTIQADDSIDIKRKQIIMSKILLAGAVFDGVACGFYKHEFIVDDVRYPILLSPSMATIGEPDSRDGAYVYITRNQGGFYKMPKPDSRIENVICIYGSFDIENPCVEFYYGELLMCSVSFIENGNQVVPHITMCDTDDLKDEFMNQSYQLIQEFAQSAIASINLSFMAGYKEGYEKAANEMNNNIEGEE
ncbi:MAG: hypothetical protein IKU29_00640 [Parabacteroides sp.]|nr:hypothetical protein [Parabacteroides sp.]